ncbi:T/G mismatch-specific endonuclease [Scopulibacillus darangshiensis]|uniref:Very short patch repair endonuclease n=1 Tax=Scopulibacillus darangshiensis TaxID=442528 RepID=A0A4R2NUJ4_9BACL|nr:very short patch repair endonuclease [Scopulibacillus darangshiensis]TCP25640.1 T/G mismatch-specific endonuclease [Scopulibacillus darangshiensis]
MADNMSKADRTKTMKAIRSQSKLENRLTKELWRKGFRFRKNEKTLFGKPDISIKKYKIAIFIDSCFWHVCPIHSTEPKSNQEYWKKKLLRNQLRDIEVNNYYIENGWNLKRVWEHDIKQDLDATVKDITSFINGIKQKK